MVRRKRSFRRTGVAIGLSGLLGFTAASQTPRFYKNYQETKRDFNTVMGVGYNKG